MQIAARVLRLILILAVVLSSAHTAVGRAEARGAAEVVICTAEGVATVRLDARGVPLAHHHGCPDCILGGLALPEAPPQATLAPRRLLARLAQDRGAQAATSADREGARARGPPAAGHA